MKRLICLLFFLIFLAGCSVQKTMNSRIFLERLSAANDSLNIEKPEIFSDDSAILYFVNDNKGTEFLFEFSVDDAENIKKIGFSCGETEKAENFVEYIRDVVSVYSPEEDADEVIMNLTKNGKLKKGINYFENQWYMYCSNADENGLFFSVTNKEMMPQSTVEFSLKPNDRVDF